MKAIIFAGLLLVMPVASQAMSVSPAPNTNDLIALTAGGCGPGFHRGPYGGCQPNGYGRPVYGRPVYGRPAYGRPAYGPHGCVVRREMTPYGSRSVRVCR